VTLGRLARAIASCHIRQGQLPQARQVGQYKSTNSDAAAGTKAHILTHPGLPGSFVRLANTLELRHTPVHHPTALLAASPPPARSLAGSRRELAANRKASSHAAVA
jgi:hypothetical protein